MKNKNKAVEIEKKLSRSVQVASVKRRIWSFIKMVVVKSLIVVLLGFGVVGAFKFVTSTLAKSISDQFVFETIIEVPQREIKVIEDVQAVEVVQDASPEAIVRATAIKHNFQSPELLVAIAKCETGGLVNGQIVESTKINPTATNGSSTALGAFQFLRDTWTEGTVATSNLDWSLYDRTDVEKATRMAIYYIHKGQINRWDASRNCWGAYL